MTNRRLTRRDVLTKSLRIGFKTAPCGCDACTPAAPAADEAAFARTMERTRQLLAATEYLLDPDPGSAKASLARRVLKFACASRIPEAERPRLRWFSPDGQRCGQAMLDRRELHLCTDLNDDELVKTIGHEVAHFQDALRGWGGGELAAERLGEMLLARWRRHNEGV